MPICDLAMVFCTTYNANLILVACRQVWLPPRMNIVSDSNRYQDLSAESRIEQARHAEVLRQYEIKKRARSINVPTAPDDVKRALREFGQPATLFGEDHADRRERLREVIAGMQISGEESAKVQAFLEKENEAAASLLGASTSAMDTTAGAEGKVGTAQQKEVFYSPADESLIQYRKEIADDSFERARVRLQSMRDILSNREETMRNSEHVYNLYQHSTDIVLNLSQFGDERPLTAIKYSPDGHYIATGSFGSEIKVWNSNDLSCQHTYYGHTDRVTSIAWQNMSHGNADTPVFASSSADGHVIVWDGKRFASSGVGSFDNNVATSMDVDDETDDRNISNSSSSDKMSQGIDESFLASVQRSRIPSYLNKIKVNANGAPVSSCAFHPHFPQLLAASCHDYSWRLYDIDYVNTERNSNQAKELMLQDGHVKECSALAFHPDGSLVMTGDAGGVSLLWDLRSGQMVQGFAGHVKKISSISFHPTNGFQVATGSLDNTVKIWDLRNKKLFYTIPAHSNLISDMTYSKSGELLLTASFDGSLKIFGSRDFRLLRNLSGHNGKVMACDMSPNEKHVVSAGYDRTIKLWAHKSEF